jgi:hypothetical protein
MNTGSRRGWLACIATVLAGLLLGTAACGSGGKTHDNAAGVQMRPSDALKWAGFNETASLELLGADQQVGLDRLVRFALRGTPADVDRALAAAEFTAPTTPGLNEYQTPLQGVDLAGLQNPRTGQDRLTNAAGLTIYRDVVRGTTGDGRDLIHVWAFET